MINKKESILVFEEIPEEMFNDEQNLYIGFDCHKRSINQLSMVINHIALFNGDLLVVNSYDTSFDMDFYTNIILEAVTSSSDMTDVTFVITPKNVFAKATTKSRGIIYFKTK